MSEAMTLSDQMRKSVEALRRNITSMTSRKPRILIVEDSENDAALLTAQLEKQCVPSDIQSVDTCEAALDLIRREAFDLVFLDLAFPGMSGVDLLKAVGSETEKIPFIAISGQGNTGDNVMREAFNNGARAIFRKNLAATELRMVCGIL